MILAFGPGKAFSGDIFACVLFPELEGAGAEDSSELSSSLSSSSSSLLSELEDELALAAFGVDAAVIQDEPFHCIVCLLVLSPAGKPPVASTLETVCPAEFFSFKNSLSFPSAPVYMQSAATP